METMYVIFLNKHNKAIQKYAELSSDITPEKINKFISECDNPEGIEFDVNQMAVVSEVLNSALKEGFSKIYTRDYGILCVQTLNGTFTKQRAIELMSFGVKMTHTYFTREEWMITQGKFNIQFEDGCSGSISRFFATRSDEDGWGTGYSIWVE